jgi:hypothetical protein
MVSNESIDWTYSGLGTVDGDIVKYENDQNYVVFRFIDHFQPMFIALYMKSEWLTEPSDTVDMQSYVPSTTSQGAEDATLVIWGPHTLTKQ